MGPDVVDILNRLTCVISRNCPATESVVYPRLRNSRSNPAAYGANGPTTLTTDRPVITDRPPLTRSVRGASIKDRDYAERVSFTAPPALGKPAARPAADLRR